MGITNTVKTPRSVLVTQIRERDGDTCAYPDCGEPIDFDVFSGPQEPTIDHWIPQVYGKANGWTMDEIWDVSNLKLMHKRCNAKKGDRIPNADGTLPPRPDSKFRFRREKRAGRPELCFVCDNGHNLFVGEVCANCGCDAQRFPRSAKVSFKECEKENHSLYWCWACSIGVVPRTGATEMMLLHGEGGE